MVKAVKDELLFWYGDIFIDIMAIEERLGNL